MASGGLGSRTTAPRSLNLKTWRCTKPWHPNPCWHTKCLDCGDTIDAFSFTAEESDQIARGRPYHDCKSDMRQLVIESDALARAGGSG